MISLKEVHVEIIGPEPPCVRCQAVRKIVETVAEKLKSSGISVKVEKLNITSGEGCKEIRGFIIAGLGDQRGCQIAGCGSKRGRSGETIARGCAIKAA